MSPSVCWNSCGLDLPIMFARCVLGMEDGYERMSLSITPRKDAGHCQACKAKEIDGDDHRKGGRRLAVFCCAPGAIMIITFLTKRYCENEAQFLPTHREALLLAAPNHVKHRIRIHASTIGRFRTAFENGLSVCTTYVEVEVTT